MISNNDYLFFQSRIEFLLGDELTIMDKQGRVRQLDINSGTASSNPKYLHVRRDQSLLFITSNSFVSPGVGLHHVECPADSSDSGG